MRTIVSLVLMIFSIWFYLIIDQKANLGRNPDDDEVIYKQERNKVTGQLLNVQIVRCRLCGQVLSYVQYNLQGKVVYGYVYTHHCGKYQTRYKGSNVWSSLPHLSEWFNPWQRRLN